MILSVTYLKTLNASSLTPTASKGGFFMKENNMTGIETTRPQKTQNDGIKATTRDTWDVTGAALTRITNPAVDMTSYEVDNLDGTLPIRATMFGKNSAGADVTIGIDVCPAGGKINHAFDELVKRNSGDLSQTLDRVEFVVLKPDEVTLAVAADITTTWRVTTRFNNK